MKIGFDKAIIPFGIFAAVPQRNAAEPERRKMNEQMLEALNEFNRAIVKFRHAYSVWANGCGISYNEMLVLYTIREFGFCTQKMITLSYLIPRQTINNVITALRKNGLLERDAGLSRGREKAFVLTEKGAAWAEPLLKSMNETETAAVEAFDAEKLRTLTELLSEYNSCLDGAMNETGAVRSAAEETI